MGNGHLAPPDRIRRSWTVVVLALLWLLATSGGLPPRGRNAANATVLVAVAVASGLGWWWLQRQSAAWSDRVHAAGPLLAAVAATFGLLRAAAIIWVRGGLEVAVPSRLVVWGAVAVAGAVLEELLFRGIIMHALWRLGLGALFIQALLFGLFHIPSTELLYIPVLVVDGLVMGALAVLGGVRYSMLAHGVLNLGVNVSVARRGYVVDSTAWIYVGWSVAAAVAALAIILLVDGVGTGLLGGRARGRIRSEVPAAVAARDGAGGR